MRLRYRGDQKDCHGPEIPREPSPFSCLLFSNFAFKGRHLEWRIRRACSPLDACGAWQRSSFRGARSEIFECWQLKVYRLNSQAHTYFIHQAEYSRVHACGKIHIYMRVFVFLTTTRFSYAFRATVVVHGFNGVLPGEAPNRPKLQMQKKNSLAEPPDQEKRSPKRR